MAIPAAAKLGLDGVETYYCYGSCNPWQPSQKQTAMVKHCGDSHGLMQTCGTDTHGLDMRRRR